MLRETASGAGAAGDERRRIGRGVKFERIRRITGYLVGKVERFNGAKRAEVRDRVRHGTEDGNGEGI